jgi:membrane protease YdiL (CAAX protease family)
MREKKLNIMDGGIVFLISVTLLLSVNLIMGFLAPRDFYSKGDYYYFVGFAEFVAVGLPPLLYLLVKKVSLKSIFKKKISVEQAVLSAALAIFAYPILVFSRLLWGLLLESLNIPMMSQQIPFISNFGMFLVGIIAVSLIPAFSEELVFRGIMQNAFQKKHKAAKAIMLTAVCFMLMHGEVYSWTYTLLAGAMLGFLYYFTGSLWPAVIYHAVNNFIGVGASYVYSLIGMEDMLSGSYDMMAADSGMLFAVIIYFVISLVSAGICVLLIWALRKVTVKPVYEPEESRKVPFISYVPYIIGGFLMVVIAVLPVVVKMITG